MRATSPKAKLIAIVAIVGLLIPAGAYAAHTFPDTPDGAFYHEPVEWALANNITTGCNGGTGFCPTDPVTRGENITFAQRYDTNIVQPALAALQADTDAAQADADAAQADADAAQAHADAAQADADANGASIASLGSDLTGVSEDVDDLREAAMLHGEVVIVESAADMQPMIIALPHAISYFADGTSVSDGMAVKALSGPGFINDVAYELHTVEYCIDNPTGDGWVTEVWVWGPTGQLLLDDTDRGAAGCWSYTIDAAPGPFSFVVVAADMAGGAVRVTHVTTTWRPA